MPVIEPVKPSEPQASEINSQITLLQRDPLLTSLDDYSILEASCLISGDDFLEIERCYNDTNFDKNYAEYLRAERLISAGIKAKVLDLTIDQNRVMTHGEAGDNVDSLLLHECYGQNTTRERWDLAILKENEDWGSGGIYLRKQAQEKFKILKG